MAEQVDEEDLQAAQAWAGLTASLAIRTPKKLETVSKLTKRIREQRRGKKRSGGK